MTLHHSAITVGTTPTLLATIPAKSDPVALLIFNNDNSAIFIGDSSITTSGANQGLQVSKSTTSSQVWLHAGDSLYGISVAGTSANAVAILYSSAF